MAKKGFHKKLKIAPTNILETRQNQQALAVYTTRSVWVPPNTIRVVEHYKGELLKDGEEDPDSSFVFELPDKTVVDASERCNYTAIINAALSQKMSNIKIQTCQTPDGSYFIEYYLDGGENGLYIQSGTQLLGFYGSTENYDDYQYGKKFMTPRDTTLNSAQIFTRFQQYNAYADTTSKLPAAFLELFDISSTTDFATPIADPIADCFDAPFLAYTKATHTAKSTFLKHQNSQENITPLMLACFTGNLEDATRLLENGADPSMPTSNKGYNSLHIVLLSQQGPASKIQLLNLLSEKRISPVPKDSSNTQVLDLIKHNLTVINDEINWCCEADLTAQDACERTLAHIAVEQGEVEVLEYLLTLEPNFWNYQDIHGNDIFETAIISGSIAVIDFLMNYLQNLDADSETYQTVMDYLLSNTKQGKSPLLSSLKCLYNKHKDEIELINSVFNTIYRRFEPVLLPDELRKIRALIKSCAHINNSIFNSSHPTTDTDTTENLAINLGV